MHRLAEFNRRRILKCGELLDQSVLLEDIRSQKMTFSK